MKIHELKTVNPFFRNVSRCEKRFELRKNDRDFQRGDILILKEYKPETNTYTGKECVVRIQSILAGFTGLEDGYCILAITDPIKPFSV